MKKNKLYLTVFIVGLPVMVLLWITFSLVFSNEFSFSILTYPESKSDTIEGKSGKLLQGDRISGRLQAKENNLGIVIVRLNSNTDFKFDSQDNIIFRIKEEGSENWHFFNSYSSSLFANESSLPIGFPPISDSKGKTYIFELESQYGTHENAIEISLDKLSLSTGYENSIDELKQSKSLMIQFVAKKAYTSFTDPGFILRSSVFLLPLLLYCLVFAFLYKFKIPKSPVFLLTITLLFTDIFLLSEFYIGVIALVLLGWYATVKNNKLDSNSSFVTGICLYVLWILTTYLDYNSILSKLSFWLFAFLVFGTVHSIIQEKYELPKGVSLQTFVRTLFKLKK